MKGGVRWLIACGCGVTFLVALVGFDSMWELQCDTSLSPFWYRDSVPLAVALVLAAAYMRAWRLPRLLCIAVLLPFVHLGAIVAAGQLWETMRGEMLRAICTQAFERHAPLPSVVALGAAFGVLAITALAIQRRRGEWAHALVMLALAGLFAVGMWLPVLGLLWGYDASVAPGYAQVSTTLMHPGLFLSFAIIPAYLAALAFTLARFRFPGIARRLRPTHAVWLVAVATFAQLIAPDGLALLYLESSYVVLCAVVLAIVAYVNLIAMTWLRSHLAARRLPGIAGTIADASFASFEVTSWLRGPLLIAEPFTVSTHRGDVPITGAEIFARIPTSTIELAIGERTPISGSAVQLVMRTDVARDGHPFRRADIASVELVALADQPYGFADLALVAWRPAVAYLAIVIAVALPGLVVLLT